MSSMPAHSASTGAGVLAEAGHRALDATARSHRALDGARVLDATEVGVVDLDDEAPGPELRVAGQIGGVLDRRRRDAGALQDVRRLVRRAGGGPVDERRPDGVDAGARGVDVAQFEHTAQPVPVGSIDGLDGEPAIGPRTGDHRAEDRSRRHVVPALVGRTGGELVDEDRHHHAWRRPRPGRGRGGRQRRSRPTAAGRPGRRARRGSRRRSRSGSRGCGPTPSSARRGCRCSRRTRSRWTAGRCARTRRSTASSAAS